MKQNKKLIDTLKNVLKEKRITYKQVAEHVGVSEGTIKRIFSTYDFTLDRLETICALADLEFSDLVEMMMQATLSTRILPLAHEKELVSNTALLLTAHLLINKWTVHQILSHYNIERLEMVRLLTQLDKMHIIDYLPGERVRLKISRNFTWIPNGPIQQFFANNIESEFFACDFTSPGEIRLFVSGMLTKTSNIEMQTKIKKLAMSFDDAHKDDEKELLQDKFGTSLLIAMRPWDIEIFNALRKPETKKDFE